MKNITAPLNNRSNKIPVETERLILRPFDKSDIPAIYEIFASEGFKFSTFGATLDDATRFYNLCIKACAQKNDKGEPLSYRYAIENRADKKLIGYFGCGGFFRQKGYEALFGHYGFERGLFIHPDYWRQGYGYEASMAGMVHLQSIGRQSLFFATVSPDNKASLNNLIKQGFTEQKLSQAQSDYLQSKYKATRTLFTKILT